MAEHILAGIIGLSGGLVISFGLIALILGLNLIPRFMSITHTAHFIRIYEKCVIAGAISGNLLTIYEIPVLVGRWLAGCFGLFGGIFLGCWVIALTEVMDMFPILMKKSGIKIGITAILLSAAIGKSIFSLLYYYRGW